jgi:hypothetical protein
MVYYFWDRLLITGIKKEDYMAVYRVNRYFRFLNAHLPRYRSDKSECSALL